MADLEAGILAWQKRLAAAGLGAEHIAELEDHLRTTVDFALDAGHSPAAALRQAIAGLGHPAAIAVEYQKESDMHPATRFVSVAVALVALCFVLWLEGPGAAIERSLPPLLVVLALAYCGITACHGPRRCLRLLAVTCFRQPLELDDLPVLQRSCRLGRRLASAAGVLLVLGGAAFTMAMLDQPARMEAGFCCCLLGLAFAVLVVELAFLPIQRAIAGTAAGASAVRAT